MTDHALEYLREKAEKSRDAIGAELAQSRVTEQEILQQIQVLKDYRKEYRGKMQRAMLEGTALHTMRDFQSFLRSLDQSIEGANNYLARQRQHIQLSMEELTKQQRSASSFGTLVNRRKGKRAEALARRETKEQDALASQIHQRSALGASTIIKE